MLSPYLLLLLLPNIGRNRVWQLLDHYADGHAILDADPDSLPINTTAQQQLADYQRRGQSSTLATQALSVMASLATDNARLIDFESPEYPPLLATTVRPPLILFAKGNVSALSLPQLAVIGSRKPSQGGEQNALIFAEQLAQHGFVITSGLALGIDGAAHRGALLADHPTIAVMATGIDTVYPKRHNVLAQDILANDGVLLTEFLPGTPPRPGHFPERNRIISGLSCAVLVVEAALKSGSLITARLAIEQDRLVFALPGSIHNPQTRGTHALIKQGAILIDSPDDIAEHLSELLNPMKAFLPTVSEVDPAQTLQAQPTASVSTIDPSLPVDEQKVLSALAFDMVSLEQLASRTQLDASELASSLMMLELKGLVRYSSWGFERVTDTVN